jgi:methylthioxylose transferase
LSCPSDRVVIGMDPHKRSATIEVMTGDEAIIGAGRGGYAAMKTYAKQWPNRVWAIEGCQGIGRHIVNRLLADGEQVLDVPPKLSARARVFATGTGASRQGVAPAPRSGPAPAPADAQPRSSTRTRSTCSPPASCSILPARSWSAFTPAAPLCGWSPRMSWAWSATCASTRPWRERTGDGGAAKATVRTMSRLVRTVVGKNYPGNLGDAMTTTVAPTEAAIGSRSTRADLVLLGIEAGLVAAAVAVGAVLNHRHVPIHADTAPLYGRWLPHLGPGTPFAIALAAAVVWRGPDLARRLSWRRLLPVTYLAALGWTLSLALVDGWRRGLATRLTPQAEYLNDVPKVHSIPAMLRTFSTHILDFQPGSWATHVSGHPPGAFLVFVVLDHVGLRGGGAAALLCVLIGATAPVSVAAALRVLGADPAARAAVPFLVLFPGAVWVGASADGLFTGVVAAGLALLAIGDVRGGVGSGLLLGFSFYFSYGLVLVGALTLAVLWLRPAPRRATMLSAVAGVAAVVGAFTASGFWWLTGYHLVVIRYYQGWAAERPYSYWVWADLACLVCCAGPVLAPALRHAAGRLRAAGQAAGSGSATMAVGSRLASAMARLRPPAGLWLLPAVALLGIMAADVSGLSKAEVERIWLPYAVWLLVAAAWLPARHRRAWLIAQTLTALAINHLLLTDW